jgi:protease I
MTIRQDLRGRRIAVLAADGVEKLELSVPVKALRAAGADVEVISLRPGRIRGVNLHEPAGRVKVDRTIDEAVPAAYDGLYIPGGFISPDLLRQSAEVRAFVRAFDRARKPIAVMCHGPWLLASAGLAEGRTLTSWPGIRDDLVHAGATWLDDELVRDGNWISSRGPQDLRTFVGAMLEHFVHTGPIRARAPRKARSAPQMEEPPSVMLTAMKWLPRPSFRTAIGLALVALGVVAARQRRRTGSARPGWWPEGRIGGFGGGDRARA